MRDDEIEPDHRNGFSRIAAEHVYHCFDSQYKLYSIPWLEMLVRNASYCRVD